MYAGRAYLHLTHALPAQLPNEIDCSLTLWLCYLFFRLNLCTYLTINFHPSSIESYLLLVLIGLNDHYTYKNVVYLQNHGYPSYLKCHGPSCDTLIPFLMIHDTGLFSVIMVMYFVKERTASYLHILLKIGWKVLLLYFMVDAIFLLTHYHKTGNILHCFDEKVQVKQRTSLFDTQCLA